ncbi:replication initiation protein [Neolewinella persica]|uniref:replication initiation protein n=1 Tax=Neolewinella persica TaxID=70998 RepID=UPI00146A2AC6|nr:replication initiation protein [Neolewinella persica]
MTPSIPTVRLMVRKSNSLVEARYKFNMWETRVFTKMITMVRMADEDFKPYRIYLRDIIQEFGLDKDKASYDLLRDGANTLLQKEVSIFQETEEGMNETRTHLIVDATTQVQGSNTNYIEVRFHPKMKPHILELKSRFTVYDVKNILNLPSSYSVRIYELLKQYEKIGYRTFEFEELKEIIGAKEMHRNSKGKMVVKDNYPLYGSFNQKILQKAQKHLLLHTDLCFEFEPLKQGRKVNKIRFIIMRNPRYDAAQVDEKMPELGMQQVSHEEDAVVSRLFVQVAPYVEEPAVRRWVKAYSEEQIQYGINYTLNQLKSGKDIQNIGGYLHTMVSTDNLVAARAAEEAKRKQARKKADKRRKELAQVEKKYEEINSQLVEKTEEVIRGIFDRFPDAKGNAFAKASKKRGSGYRSDRSNAENMADPIFRAVFRGMVRKNYPEHFAALKTLEDWAKKLRGQMGRLR